MPDYGEVGDDEDDDVNAAAPNNGNISDFLLNSPLQGSGIQINRDRDPGRQVCL